MSVYEVKSPFDPPGIFNNFHWGITAILKEKVMESTFFLLQNESLKNVSFFFFFFA